MKRKLMALAALILAVCMLLSSCASAGSADTAGNTTADNTMKNTSPSRPTVDSENPTAHNAVIEDEAELLNLLANIKSEDIIRLSEPSLSAEELVSLLNKVPKQLTQHEPFDYGHAWCWFASVDLSAGRRNRIGICAGLEENIIEISCNGLRIHSDSPELYWLMRSIYDYEPSIDDAALARFKDVLTAHMESLLAFYKDIAPDAGFYGYEITNLILKSTFDDIVDGKVYVYQFNFALQMQHPEHMPIYGGIFMDSKLRMRRFDNEPYLVVFEIGGKLKHAAFMSYDLYYGAHEDGEKNAREKISYALENSLLGTPEK